MDTGKQLTGRAPAGSPPPATVSPTVPDEGRATSGTHDLQRLRAWRAGSPSQALVLHGYDGKNGATLIEWRNGARREARYESVSLAAVALASGYVPWQKAAERPQQGRFFEGRRAAAVTTRKVHL